MGRRLFKPGFFLGVFPAKQHPPTPPHSAFYIINEDDGAGMHWMGVALEPGFKPLLFDSFGRTPSAHWQPWLRHMEPTDPDRDQEFAASNCGELSVAFGKIFEQFGRAAAKSI